MSCECRQLQFLLEDQDQMLIFLLVTVAGWSLDNIYIFEYKYNKYCVPISLRLYAQAHYCCSHVDRIKLFKGQLSKGFHAKLLNKRSVNKNTLHYTIQHLTIQYFKVWHFHFQRERERARAKV